MLWLLGDCLSRWTRSGGPNSRSAMSDSVRESTDSWSTSSVSLLLSAGGNRLDFVSWGKRTLVSRAQPLFLRATMPPGVGRVFSWCSLQARRLPCGLPSFGRKGGVIRKGQIGKKNRARSLSCSRCRREGGIGTSRVRGAVAGPFGFRWNALLARETLRLTHVVAGFRASFRARDQLGFVGGSTVRRTVRGLCGRFLTAKLGGAKTWTRPSTDTSC